jgi:hypothetical protein
MAILARSGATSARLRFAAGPGGAVALRTAVDWAAWPAAAADPVRPLAARAADWAAEYAARVEPSPVWPPDLVAFDDVFAEDLGTVLGADPFPDGGWYEFG